MNKKIGVIALALCVSAAAFVSAQNVDNKVIGFETSVIYDYNLDSAAATAKTNVGNATSAGVVLTLADNIAAGFSYVKPGTNTYATTLFSLTYGIMDKAGATLSFGSWDNTVTGATVTQAVTGIGIYYNIFEKKEPISTTLKMKLDYLFAPSYGIEKGDLRIALALGVGI